MEKSNKLILKRHEKREGLIRARLTGTKLSSGEVIVFLDSHCEVTEGAPSEIKQSIELMKRSIVITVFLFIRMA